MTAVTVEEMTARLGDILSRAAKGQEFVVTDGGRAVARVVPPAAPAAPQLVRDMLAFRDQAGRTLGGTSARELRDDGRRF
jgi:antitoxin (DNA-binding transcriptional repressor) of toxin-antitoxin stability system